MSGGLKKLLIAVVVIFGGGFLLVMFYGGAVVKGSVEEYGPEFTGTSVTLSDVSFSPMSGTAGLSGLEIGSPQGFEAEKTFSLTDISVTMDTTTLLSETVHINEIRITDPEIIVEYLNGNLNINALMDNLADYSSDESNETTNVIIDDLYITGARVTVMGLPLDSANQTLELPEIHLEDIGNEDGNNEGATFIEASQETMAAVTTAVTAVLTNAQIKGIIEKGKEIVGKTLKGLFGGKDDDEEDDDGS